MTVDNDTADVTPLLVAFRPGMCKCIAAAVDALLGLLDQRRPFEDDAPRDEGSCGLGFRHFDHHASQSYRPEFNPSGVRVWTLPQRSPQSASRRK
jgi:hypothetical protein